MRERQLIAAVNRRIPKSIHHQSMTFGSRSCNGVPDRYYDGPKSDLWVEYKQLDAMPRSEIVIGAYTALQLQWMERRWRHGGNVVGIVGLPNRTAVVQTDPEQWRRGTPISAALPLKDISLWITDFCSP